jgi:hypothetical protein
MRLAARLPDFMHRTVRDIGHARLALGERLSAKGSEGFGTKAAGWRPQEAATGRDPKYVVVRASFASN